MNSSDCGKYECLLSCVEEEQTCNRAKFLEYAPCPPPLNYPYTEGYYRSFMIGQAHLEKAVAETVMQRCSLRWTYPVETTTTQWSTATMMISETSTSSSTPPSTTSASSTIQSGLSSTSAVTSTTSAFAPPTLEPPVTTGSPTISSAATFWGVLIAVVVVVCIISFLLVIYCRRQRLGRKKRQENQFYTQFSNASTISGGSVSMYHVDNAKHSEHEYKQDFKRTGSNSTEQESLSEVGSDSYLNYQNTLPMCDKSKLNQTSRKEEKFKDNVQTKSKLPALPGIDIKETEIEKSQNAKLSLTAIPATHPNINTTIADVQGDCHEALSEQPKEQNDGNDEINGENQEVHGRKSPITDCTQVHIEIQDPCQASAAETNTSETPLTFINAIH